MRGELRATVVRIDAPYVSVERDRDGRVSGPAVVAGGEVTIDRIAVSDGRVSLADTSSGAKAVLDNVSFKGEIRAPVGPIRGAGAFVVEGPVVQLSYCDQPRRDRRRQAEPRDRPI